VTLRNDSRHFSSEDDSAQPKTCISSSTAVVLTSSSSIPTSRRERESCRLDASRMYSSRHARSAYDSQRSCYPHMPIGKVWMHRLLFVCVFFVCSYGYGFFRRGVKFFPAVHRRPWQEIPHFCELCSQKPKIGRIGERAGHAHLHVNITVEMPT